VILFRVSENEHGTYGVLIHGKTPFALTLENQWIDNKVDVSCIPKGKYVCERYTSVRFGNTFRIKDVPGRSGIALHWGNTDKDTRGCVLIGEEFGVLGDKTAILASKRGFKEFMKITQDMDEFVLNIL